MNQKPNPLSLYSLFLKFYFNDQKLAVGSGFIYKKHQEHFLITNWHNLSGRDPETLQPLCKNGGIPNKIVTEIWEIPDSQNSLMRRRPVEITLKENENEPTWFEHPKLGSKIDVGVLPLTTDDTRHHLKSVNEFEFTDISPGVGMDVFILGYPLGITTKFSLPIWKRATIASEPMFPIDDLPKILVDTATREGMSGSAVFLRYIGPYSKNENDSPVFDWIGTGFDFLGIYSGRLGASQEDDEFKAQLGIVWKKEVISDIIDRKKKPNLIVI